MQTGELVESLRRRWASAGFPGYPPWIALIMDGSAAAIAVAACVQRAGEHPLLPVSALMLVALSPWLAAFAGFKAPWPLFAALTLGGTTAAMVLYPVEYDFGLFLLVLMAGHIGAMETLPRSASATALAGTVLVVLDGTGDFNGSKFWFAALVIGWDVGFIMRHQQLALEEQLRSQAAREEQVALEERQRIAREVHDVIAHSLSVTMLHLTAARRDLEEDRDGDVDEAIAALRDAERLGRQAMGDIRRTVGLLGSPGPGAIAPAPDLHDVPALVEEFRAAGLDVTVRSDVAADSLPAPVGLGIYRVLQESLANVAKHEPRAAVHVVLERVAADGDHVQLTVLNDVTEMSGPAPDGLGSGLRGMRERAELLGGTLSAGREGTTWRVRLSVPVLSEQGAGEPARCHALGMVRRPVEELS